MIKIKRLFEYVNRDINITDTVCLDYIIRNCKLCSFDTYYNMCSDENDEEYNDYFFMLTDELRLFLKSTGYSDHPDLMGNDIVERLLTEIYNNEKEINSIPDISDVLLDITDRFTHSLIRGGDKYYLFFDAKDTYNITDVISRLKRFGYDVFHKTYYGQDPLLHVICINLYKNISENVKDIESEYHLRNIDGSRKRYLEKDYEKTLSKCSSISKDLRSKNSPYLAKISKVMGEKGDHRIYNSIEIYSPKLNESSTSIDDMNDYLLSFSDDGFFITMNELKSNCWSRINLSKRLNQYTTNNNKVKKYVEQYMSNLSSFYNKISFKEINIVCYIEMRMEYDAEEFGLFDINISGSKKDIKIQDVDKYYDFDSTGHELIDDIDVTVYITIDLLI